MKFPWSEVRTFVGYSNWHDYRNISIPVSITWLQIFSILGPILLVESSISLVHYAINHALFLDREPYFCIPDVEFQMIVAEFLKYGIIDIDQDKIILTKAGKRCLHTIRIPVDEILNIIHMQVMEVCNSIPQKSVEEISNYIKLLSNFNSNPEATNYIGQTLLSLRVFLSNQDEWDKKQVEAAQKEIKDILNEASESERVEIGAFDPIFNLSKIMGLIDFLNAKLHESRNKQ